MAFETLKITNQQLGCERHLFGLREGTYRLGLKLCSWHGQSYTFLGGGRSACVCIARFSMAMNSSIVPFEVGYFVWS